jgi:hypothetical protein
MKNKLLLLVLGFAVTTQMIFAQVPTYVPTSGLVAYYPFTGNANDATSNANNGVVNGVTLTADKNGNPNSAYLFNGTSNNIGLSQPFLGGVQVNSFSFFTRFKTIGSPPNTSTGCYNLWGKSFFWGEINFGIAPDNTIYIIWFNSNGGNTATHIQTNSSIIPNSWNDLVINFNNSQVDIYLNGVLQVVTNFYGTNSLANFAQDVNSSKIGSRIISGQTVGFFNGIIDDLGVWNRVLTQNEINNLSYTDTTCSTLVINTGVLSLNPPTFTNTVTIYPNPANYHITIDCGNLANVSGWTIKIVNTLGQEVFSGAMNTQQYVVPLNSWSGQGVYFVKIYDASNNLLNTKKIILQ